MRCGVLPDSLGVSSRHGAVFESTNCFGTVFMDEPAGLRTPVCLGLLFLLLLGAVQRWHMPTSLAANRLFAESSFLHTRATPTIVGAHHPGTTFGLGSTLSIMVPPALGPVATIEANRPDSNVINNVINGDVEILEPAADAAGSTSTQANSSVATGSADGLVPIDVLANERRQQDRAQQLADGELVRGWPTSRAPALTRIFDELQARRRGRPEHLTQVRTEVSAGIPAAAPKAAPRESRPAGKPQSSCWPSCPVLKRELSSLTQPQSQSWAQRVQSTLDALYAAELPCDAQTRQALQELQNLAEEAQRIAPALREGESELLITAYDVRRRADIWQAVSQAAEPEVQARARSVAESIDRREMLARIADIRKALKQISHGPAWTEYLMLDQLATFTATPAVHDVDKRRQMACLVLSKRDTALSEKQIEFLNSSLIVALDNELKRWATYPVDMHDLLHKLEEFERKPYTRYATYVTEIWSALRWSILTEYNHLASLIDIHYRNANVRISVTEDFVNRMIPAVQAVRSPVREKILGADVSGQSHSQMKMKVDLMNDPDEIRLRMQADGNLAANTQSKAGTVTLYNMNRSSFIIEKLFVVGRQGIQTAPAKASASGRSSLLGLQTRYDPFPIIGSIVRRVATQKAFETRGLQRSIFLNRVAQKAQSQVDTKVQHQLAETEKQVAARVLTPLDQMHLSPTTISMSSTDHRANYRGRLAGDHQLAAFTARPRELPHNVVSIQVHNSAINNFLRQLELDGQRGELRDIIQNVMHQFDLNAVAIPEEIPDDVYIALAESDAVRVECDDDRVSIILAIAELSTEHRSWRNFFVRAHYTPDRTHAFQCDLTRDGPVELQGRRKLSGGDDLALRAIFTKVFSKSRSIPLIHPQLTKDPRTQDLHVDQFVARDGWVAISVGQVQPTPQAHQPHPQSRSATQAVLDKIRRR